MLRQRETCPLVLLLLLYLHPYSGHHEVSSFALQINLSYPLFAFSSFSVFPLLPVAASEPLQSEERQMVSYVYQFIPYPNLFLLSDVFEALLIGSYVHSFGLFQAL